MAKLYSLIIGINAYDVKANALYGCVNDALDVANYFQNLCASQTDQPLEWKPKYLLAPHSQDVNQNPALADLDFDAPTRSNIIAAFDHLKQAQDGDFCLLYYSGHGSTVAAPPVFKGYAPGDTFQTIVCQDSRTKGITDLMDKELGYLISTVTAEKPGVHFVAFMDCCHSGSNTRNIDDNAPVSRMQVKGPEIVQVLGFDRKGNTYYKATADGANITKEHIKFPRHISLAGARDSESAYEIPINMHGGMVKRGVFTWSILETLRQGGTQITYADLVKRAEMSVRARVDNQIPQLGKDEAADDDLLFLRNAFQSPTESYAVTFERGEWRMGAGTINGLVGPEVAPATVLVFDAKTGDKKPVPVSILRMDQSFSVLDGDHFTEKDKGSMTLKAKVHRMAFPEVKIGIDAKLPAAMKSAIEAAFNGQKPRYAGWAKSSEAPQYVISCMKNADDQDCYVLLRPGSVTPVFMRTVEPAAFVADVDRVTRYDYVIKMDNPNTQLPRNTVKVDLRTLEGEPFSAQTINAIPEDKFKAVPPQSAAFPYPAAVRVSGVDAGNDKTIQPAIRVRLSPTAPCFVGALYCDAKREITPDFLRIQKIGGPGEAPFADLEFVKNGNSYNTIPLTIDKAWKDLGVTETQDFLLIFVSNNTFSLKEFKQSGIKLDATRAADFDDDTPIQMDDWYVIKIPIHISIPKSKQALGEGDTKSFKAFSVTAPEGFSATVEALTTKNANNQRGILEPLPEDLFAGAETRPEVFARGIGSAPDEHLNIVELTGVTGDLSPEKPLVLTPADPLEDDESILPVAYDPVHQIYYPVGYTDTDGNVRIDKLPAPTEGSYGTAPEGQKSLGSAIKLYFKKMVWGKITGRPQVNKLSILDENGEIAHTYQGSDRAADQAALQVIREKVANGNVLLMVHGIIGDLENPLKFVQDAPGVRAHFDAILTYEYENLDTPIEKTAEILLKSLRDTGIPPQGLTILAHSMGGLVSRVLIEQLDGADLVKRLVQLGTPNGGSEIGDFRKKLFGWIALGLNGVAALKPYMSFASLLWKGIDQSLFRTLEQMRPSSEFLSQLNSTQGRTTPYYLVAGNTSLIEISAGEDESIIKQALTGLKERGLYILVDYGLYHNEPNDMAVRIQSMQTVPGGFVDTTEVACDHVSYFSYKGLEQLMVAPSK